MSSAPDDSSVPAPSSLVGSMDVQVELQQGECAALFAFEAYSNSFYLVISNTGLLF